MGGRIESEQEVVRWILDGKTYAWMSEEHFRKYGVRLSPTTFAAVRSRRGLPPRKVQDAKLIPWAVAVEHRHAYDVALLRILARKRAGGRLTSADEARLRRWLAFMDETGTVLHYEPDTEQGWFYVPRREGIDLDVIREPDAPTRERGRL